MRIDRLTPTHRPASPVVGWQTWRDLLFAHWTVPVEAVRPLLPPALEPDLHEGQLYLGLVPFRMCGVRPRWLVSWLALDFLEANLRTYVLHKGEPGVFFFSLEAASWLAVQAARLGWSLPYFHALMQLQQTPQKPDAASFECAPGTRFQYGSARRSGVGFAATCRVGEPLGPSQPGSLEYFLLERYLLFTARRGRVLRGQVHHSPYPVLAAELESFEESLFAAAGLPAVSRPPDCVHFSPGVEVEIFRLTPTGDCETAPAAGCGRSGPAASAGSRG